MNRLSGRLRPAGHFSHHTFAERLRQDVGLENILTLLVVDVDMDVAEALVSNHLGPTVVACREVRAIIMRALPN